MKAKREAREAERLAAEKAVAAAAPVATPETEGELNESLAALQDKKEATIASASTRFADWYQDSNKDVSLETLRDLFASQSAARAASEGFDDKFKENKIGVMQMRKAKAQGDMEDANAELELAIQASAPAEERAAIQTKINEAEQKIGYAEAMIKVYEEAYPIFVPFFEADTPNALAQQKIADFMGRLKDIGVNDLDKEIKNGQTLKWFQQFRRVTYLTLIKLLGDLIEADKANSTKLHEQLLAVIKAGAGAQSKVVSTAGKSQKDQETARINAERQAFAKTELAKSENIAEYGNQLAQLSVALKEVAPKDQVYGAEF